MGDAALRLADELAVQRLISTYCQTVDDGRFAEVAMLFADDGVFENRACGSVSGSWSRSSRRRRCQRVVAGTAVDTRSYASAGTTTRTWRPTSYSWAAPMARSS